MTDTVERKSAAETLTRVVVRFARDSFVQRDLEKVGYLTNPLEDGSLSNYRVVEVPMTSLTIQATVPLGVKNRDAERSKNFFALGMISWLFSRPREPTWEWINSK